MDNDINVQQKQQQPVKWKNCVNTIEQIRIVCDTMVELYFHGINFLN